MAQLSIIAGSTSQSILAFIQNSTSTTGAGLTAVAPAGGSLLTGTIGYYSFTGTSATATTLGTLTPLAAVNSAWSSAGIVTLDDTHMPGWIRLDLPNAVLAASSGRVVAIHIQGGTNMAPCPILIELTGWNNQATIGSAVWQDAVSGDFTASSSIGKSLYTSGNAPGTASGLFIAGTNAATTITTSLTTHLIGTVDTVTTLTNAANINLAQTLSAFGSALTSGTADTAITVNQALHGAMASVGGQEVVSGTTYTTKTSTGTTIRAFTLDQNPNPNQRT